MICMIILQKTLLEVVKKINQRTCYCLLNEKKPIEIFNTNLDLTLFKKKKNIRCCVKPYQIHCFRCCFRKMNEWARTLPNSQTCSHQSLLTVCFLTLIILLILHSGRILWLTINHVTFFHRGKNPSQLTWYYNYLLNLAKSIRDRII